MPFNGPKVRGLRVHRSSCWACGAEPIGHAESMALEVAILRSIGAALPDVKKWDGSVVLGRHMAGTVLWLLGEPARGQALIEVF